jgi:hypothetical protein
MSKLQLQINSKHVSEKDCKIKINNVEIMFTPPVGNHDYWIFRVPLSEIQAIIGFPKFTLIGIGFEKEEDWNTNLPSGCTTKEIFNHIKHNKGDDKISDEDCIAAIKMIQKAAKVKKENLN